MELIPVFGICLGFFLTAMFYISLNKIVDKHRKLEAEKHLILFETCSRELENYKWSLENYKKDVLQSVLKDSEIIIENRVKERETALQIEINRLLDENKTLESKHKKELTDIRKGFVEGGYKSYIIETFDNISKQCDSKLNKNILLYVLENHPDTQLDICFEHTYSNFYILFNLTNGIFKLYYRFDFRFDPANGYNDIYHKYSYCEIIFSKCSYNYNNTRIRSLDDLKTVLEKYYKFEEAAKNLDPLFKDQIIKLL